MSLQTVSRIAMEFNYHPNYLSTLFKRVTGDTLLHYINRQKVSYSEELLLNTVLPIKQIALSSGFEDRKHFMKLFKQYKGSLKPISKQFLSSSSQPQVTSFVFCTFIKK